MNEVEIYFLEGSDNLFGSDSYTRGYWLDVYVLISKIFYKVNVYHIERLKQDYESAIDHQGYYPIDPNIILVKEVTDIEITWTISNLHKYYKYFDNIKPISTDEIKNLKLLKM